MLFWCQMFRYLLRRKVSCPSRLTGRFFPNVYFKHSFFNNVILNQSTSYGDNLGSSVIADSVLLVFFLSLVVRWFYGLTMTSYFLVFVIGNARDDVFDAANNNNGDDTIVAVGGWDGIRCLSVLPETSLFVVFDFVGDLDAWQWQWRHFRQKYRQGSRTYSRCGQRQSLKRWESG